MANKQFNSIDGYSVGNTISVINSTGNVTANAQITRNSRNVPTYVYQANTPPSSPLVGDQWYNTTSGVLFEYLDDGTTAQWVDVNGIPGIIASSLSATANTVTNNAQPNITSVGTLTGLVMAGNITPSSTNTYSLGNTTNRWDNLWLAGNTIYLGNADIKANATSLILTNPGGGQLVVSGTGVASSNNIYNGNSNVNIATANGNVTIAAVGNTTMTITGTGANVTGTFRSTGATVLASGSGNVGIGNTAPGQKLTVAGTVESTTGGFKFPDGTTQTTAAAGGGGGVTTFSAGSTGFNPSSASNGNVTLSGTLYVTSGGTGVSSSPTSGQLLIGTSFGSYNLGTLTAGNGISITNTSGNITIAAGATPPVLVYIVEFGFTAPGSGSYDNLSQGLGVQSPVVFYDSGTFEATVWFYAPGGPLAGYNTSGTSISQINIFDSDNVTHTFYDGVDFTFSGNWYANGGVIGFYGLSISNTTLRTLMADTMAQLISPSVSPRSISQYSAQSTVYASVSGGPDSSYYSGGRPVMLRTSSNGSNEIVFKSDNATASYGLSLSYLQIADSSGNTPYFYSGTDWTSTSFVYNENGYFLCQLNGLSPNLQALFDNTIII